ncbi:MAG: sulfur carrier protein ThiS [Solirubrobacteraceae bacterium]|nr:sulfur carrier protein ThiS [Solirubrobacteraceae bacterium]
MTDEIVTVNGEARPVAGRTVGWLVDDLGLSPGGRGVAVALDGDVVRRDDWPSVVLRAGQRVEVLSAIQGG